MKNLINSFLRILKDKKKRLYWIEWTLIVIAHLVLLKWILFALNEGSLLPTEEMLMHFTGIGLYGAGLIRLCAWLAQRRYEKVHGKLRKS